MECRTKFPMGMGHDWVVDWRGSNAVVIGKCSLGVESDKQNAEISGRRWFLRSPLRPKILGRGDKRRRGEHWQKGSHSFAAALGK